MVDLTTLGTGVTHGPGAEPPPTLRRWLLSRERDRRRERILGAVLLVAALVLAGWTVYLGSADSPRALHRPWALATVLGMNPYTLIWVGIDVLETLGLALIGIFLRLGRAATHTVALLALPLFLLDAWFDILTSMSLHRLVVALVMAAASEVPAAVTCGWVAWKASRFAPSVGRLAAPLGG
ncbi:MAG: hypothetical protein BGO37_11505 [Cellulomonas sp. 73-92]|uniref:hypothetical protein n=1 Tax=Cellulomonas sp. 73-92 TaxID=1895740 RepID=UPI000926A2A9|nr:hypothetical protein [Cellulomonas sp. 73-92]OJV76650.1 MAG: hypothetical protein BGO37_11505 [Cellulomonas sp. 73-92]